MSYQKSLCSIVVLITLLLAVQAQALGVIFEDGFESDQGWTVNPSGTDIATTGMWERGIPDATIDSSSPQRWALMHQTVILMVV